MEFIATHGPEIGEALIAIIGGFSVLARFTPNKSVNKFLQGALSFINLLAQNNGKYSKNAEPPDPELVEPTGN